MKYLHFLSDKSGEWALRNSKHYGQNHYYLAGCTMFPHLPAELQNINLYLLLQSILYMHFRSQWKADVRNNFQNVFL